jgi:hypothetical protein
MTSAKIPIRIRRTTMVDNTKDTKRKQAAFDTSNLDEQVAKADRFDFAVETCGEIVDDALRHSLDDCIPARVARRIILRLETAHYNACDTIVDLYRNAIDGFGVVFDGYEELISSFEDFAESTGLIIMKLLEDNAKLEHKIECLKQDQAYAYSRLDNADDADDADAYDTDNYKGAHESGRLHFDKSELRSNVKGALFMYSMNMLEMDELVDTLIDIVDNSKQA